MIFAGWFLTVDSQGDLGLPDSDPRDDGFAHVLAGISLAHGIQIQLVAVAQNLEEVDENTPVGPKLKAHMDRKIEEVNVSARQTDYLRASVLLR